MTSWLPTAPLSNLRQRAELIAKIRQFFADKGVLEVDTPLMCHTTATDLHIASIPAVLAAHTPREKTFYLQTSPEFAMKRLLAAGSGAIYQICKAFRDDELGNLHNPEFTLLEWYQPHYDHFRLMDEVDELLQAILTSPPAERLSYADVFLHHLNINPHIATIADLQACAHDQLRTTETVHWKDASKDLWLHYLMSHYIEPHLGKEKPLFIYDYPASQAALAKIRHHPTFSVAERFEVYIRGIELANGFHELCDAQEQRLRFERDLAQRKQLGLPQMPLDEYLLVALDHGLPPCAGVALGIDRLLMLALQAKQIGEVMSFSIVNA